MSVKIGSVSVTGSGFSLPRERARAKQALKSIAKMCGVDGVYFVRTKPRGRYGGYYDFKNKRIIVVEQEGTCCIPMWLVAWRFLHELTHHLHTVGGLFHAYYYDEVVFEDGSVKEYTTADRRRVALRAERHANTKASEMSLEFFDLELIPPEYSKEYLKGVRKDLFG